MDNMVKRKMTIEKLLEQDHYKAIIFLIGTFQQKGIRFLHLNYVLVEQHNIATKTIETLFDFFEGRLTEPPLAHLFYKSIWPFGDKRFVFDSNIEPEIKIIKGKSGVTNLGNFLRELRDKQLIERYYVKKGTAIWEQRLSKKITPYYRLTKEGEDFFQKMHLKELIDGIQYTGKIPLAIRALQKIIEEPPPH